MNRCLHNDGEQGARPLHIYSAQSARTDAEHGDMATVSDTNATPVMVAVYTGVVAVYTGVGLFCANLRACHRCTM